MQPSTSSSSGLSIPRSSSSLSVYRDRPTSSLSTRPHSRLSIRHARSSRLLSLCQTLVTQLTGLDEGKDGGARFRAAVASAMNTLESNKAAAVSVDMEAIDQQILGHALKARINSRDQLSEALETCFKRLRTQIEATHDLDQEIKASRLPDHLQCLLSLSTTPSALTLQHASFYLENGANLTPPPAPLTWAAILAEEPFEGEHWEGVYGLPPGFVRRSDEEEERHKKGGFYDREKESQRLDWDSRWSTPSLSPLNSGDLALDEETDDDVGDIASGPDREQDMPLSALGGGRSTYKHPPHTYGHRKEFEALQEKQYWRETWKGDGTVEKKVFNMGDVSTLGPALRTILRPPGEKTRSTSINLDFLVQREKYINEEDAVREVLMALQGRKNIMLQWKDDENAEGSYIMTKVTPSLRHLSLTSQASMLSSLAHSATTLQRLRRFVADVFEQTRSRYTVQPQYWGGKSQPTRTLEAFADAVDAEIRALDTWCAAREEAMCRAWGGAGVIDANDDMQPLVISLLGTEKDVQDAFDGTFEVLLDVLKEVYPSSSTNAARARSAALLSTMLLDKLFEKAQRHLERQEKVTSEALMRVFVRTVEPIWAMIGKWLRDGMGLGMGMGVGTSGGAEELEDEFFIQGSGLGLGMMGMGLLDPEFWKEGYALRESVVFDEDGTTGERRRKTIPQILEHVAEPVLGAGKAVGLLRALGVPPSPSSAVSNWQTFGMLVGLSISSSSPPSAEQLNRAAEGNNLFAVSIDTLSRLIYDRLLPQCDVAGALLAQVLVDECALRTHLASIEDLFLMRRGDTISHFVDVLFAKMDAQQTWSDFHFLNTAFRDVVEASTNAGAKEWVQTSLVRLSYRGSKDKDKTIHRTVKAIDGLLVEYAVPFPLTYIFQPATIRVYAEIFAFLLQIRRAKSVLERVLVRGEARAKTLRAELKVFYAMRSRLSWFINTLLNFLTTYVIHTQVLKFHEAFRAAKSLDEMIQLHDDHLDKIQGRCLLKPNTSSLHRAILSILDLALHFTDFFVTFAGDTTITHDVSRQSISIRGHRSRRQRRQRKNVIGFVQSLQGSLDSSDEDEDDFDVDVKDAPEPSFSLSASVSYAEEGMTTRMDKMSLELDGLVRFLRRGVESLAGGGSEAAPTFGVLAFALEDWDN